MKDYCCQKVNIKKVVLELANKGITSSPIYTKEKSKDIAETLYRIRRLWNMKFEGVDND